MTLQQTKARDSLDSSNCDTPDEINYAHFQRQQENISAKVWIRNLPEGISERGLRNLFLTVGEPIGISVNPKTKSALVKFELMNQVELAIRDLHCKPPYNLRVTLAIPRPKHDAQTNGESPVDKREDIFLNVSQQGSAAVTGYSQQKDENKTVGEVENQMKSILDCEPSLRMRQKKLDFRTESKCVSRGRGYLNMGDKDRFVGGLHKFECSSVNSKAKDMMRFSCENCQALTTKICGNCSAPYCSNVCLNGSDVDHRRSCRIRGAKRCTEDADLVGCWSDGRFPEVALESGCTVVMTSYLTMATVFVRPCDGAWEEKFVRLCNDVAIEVPEGKKLEVIPSLEELVIARYYEDLCFYRGQVRSSSVDENKIAVFFVDFGNTQETRLEDLIVMPDHLKSLPGLAVKVRLRNVLETSSMDAVDYYNKLTAESVHLILKLADSKEEVVLIEKDSKAIVNETVFDLALPSWKKDNSAFSKTGEIFYIDSIKPKRLEIGKTYDLTVSHFNEKEFLESEVFWATDQRTEEFAHAATEMLLGITEYCRFLEGDSYLPRTNELCLANENGKWHRCINLKSQKTNCCLFFLDDGHSSFVGTNSIRKMIRDFTEIPAQSICCTLPDEPKLKNDKEYQSKVVAYLKAAVGRTVASVRVLKLLGDAYCLDIPDVTCLLQRKS